MADAVAYDTGVDAEDRDWLALSRKRKVGQRAKELGEAAGAAIFGGTLKGNPNHEPAGSPVGGQFASGDSTIVAVPDARKLSIRAIEDEIVRKRIEHGALIDPDGKVLFRVKGKESEIELTSEQISDFAGNTFTHNHPGGDMSFSLEDAMVAYQGNPVEMRAVTTKHKYVMRPKEDSHWPETETILQTYKDFLASTPIRYPSWNSFWLGNAGKMGLEYKEYGWTKK